METFFPRKMNIEDQVALAVNDGLSAVMDLADELGEKAFVVFDIVAINHPDMWGQIQEEES
jgi:hypothetical protein